MSWLTDAQKRRLAIVAAALGALGGNVAPAVVAPAVELVAAALKLFASW